MVKNDVGQSGLAENDSNRFYLFGYDETCIKTIQFVKFVISLLYSPAALVTREQQTKTGFLIPPTPYVP